MKLNDAEMKMYYSLKKSSESWKSDRWWMLFLNFLGTGSVALGILPVYRLIETAGKQGEDILQLLVSFLGAAILLFSTIKIFVQWRGDAKDLLLLKLLDEKLKENNEDKKSL
jgi:hypothetical protein